jgi:hypothetical protein
MLPSEPDGAMPLAVFIAILERTITSDVHSTDTIRDLKAMLHQAEGIPPFHQLLKPRFSYGFFNPEMNNSDLSNDATLAELNVTRGDSFLLRRSRSIIHRDRHLLLFKSGGCLSFYWCLLQTLSHLAVLQTLSCLVVLQTLSRKPARASSAIGFKP